MSKVKTSLGSITKDYVTNGMHTFYLRFTQRWLLLWCKQQIPPILSVIETAYTNTVSIIPPPIPASISFEVSIRIRKYIYCGSHCVIVAYRVPLYWYPGVIKYKQTEYTFCLNLCILCTDRSQVKVHFPVAVEWQWYMLATAWSKEWSANVLCYYEMH